MRRTAKARELDSLFELLEAMAWVIGLEKSL
jgi:hypothetical protein